MDYLTHKRILLFFFSWLIALVIISTPAYAAKKSNAVPTTCLPGQSAPYQPYVQKEDVWNSSQKYRFPFFGWSALHAKKIKKTKTKPAYTKYYRSTVLWKKIKKSNRTLLYPAPNMPSCRLARRGTEDRSSYKALTSTSLLRTLDGVTRSWVIKDTFDRDVANITYQFKSLNPKFPNRYGWYINNKWAGHDASRMFEVQGKACKLTPSLQTVNGVQSWLWINDPNYVMIAINPAAGSPNGNTRPYNLTPLKIRGFINIAALPGSLQSVAKRYNFGCGQTSLTPFLSPQPLMLFNVKSGTSNGHLVNQYFGESSVQIDLLPGEVPKNNNYYYSTYNYKLSFNNATYVMNNTTGVGSGGMVRALARAGVDNFSLIDEMKYCDPNYTLSSMKIRSNGKLLPKSQFFKPEMYSLQNKASVRWVFGEITPNLSTLSPEGQAAAANPLSQKVYGWSPIHCDR